MDAVLHWLRQGVDWPFLLIYVGVFIAYWLKYDRDQKAEALERLMTSFEKWGQHLRGCPARKRDADPEDCECGLTEFREELEGD